ncbi:hypothetical protein ScPMuIL_001395 [Solemya velum]
MNAKEDNICAALHGKKDLRLDRCPIPEPNDEEVQINIKHCGVCGTDQHIWRDGEIGGGNLTYPHIIGHEAAGIITKVGAKVTNLKIGDRVAVEAVVPCYKCHVCTSGSYNLCGSRALRGTVHGVGLLTRYTVCSHYSCFRLPDTLSTEVGAMMEPLAVTVRACERSQLQVGETVLVCGSGTIGMMVLQVVKACGARSVCVTDISPYRLQLATKLGADHTINVSGLSSKEAAAQIKQTVGGTIDVSFECVGNDPAIATAIYATRSGGRMVMIGIPSGNSEVPLSDAVLREVSIIPTVAYVNSYPIAISLAEQGKVDVTSLISHRLPLERVIEAFETKNEASPEELKCMIHI